MNKSIEVMKDTFAYNNAKVGIHINGFIKRYNKYSPSNQKEPLLSHSVPLQPQDWCYFTTVTQDYLFDIRLSSEAILEIKSADTSVQIMNIYICGTYTMPFISKL